MGILQNDIGLVTVHPLGNIVKDNLAAGFHRLSRSKGHMGSYDGVLAVQQRVSGVQRRLGLKDVNARAAEIAAVEGISQKRR